MEHQNTRPSAEDAARRLIILTYINRTSMLAPILELPVQWSLDDREKVFRNMEENTKQLWQGLKDAGLWNYMSPQEQNHAGCRIAALTRQQLVDASWKLEGIGILAWALGHRTQLLPFDTMASHESFDQISIGDMDVFIRSARLRQQSEIDNARELAEFWHWRSRTRELIKRNEPFPDAEEFKAAGFHSYDDIVRATARVGEKDGLIPACVDEDFPAKGKAYRDLSEEEWSEIASITFERHFTLNWLCGYAPDNQWDETPTGT